MPPYSIEEMSLDKPFLFPALEKQIAKFELEYPAIPAARKLVLNKLSALIEEKQHASEPINLNFICTHNSRRSHIAQLWAQVAAAFYGIENVYCFSGGTEATAFNPRAVWAMQNAGFSITKLDNSANPRYEASFGSKRPLLIFSKTYDDPFNPATNFAAVMTCSHADENCPVVTGAIQRISLPYNDPKDFDNTALEAEKYTERVQEIGREICFALSTVKSKRNRPAQY